MDLTKAMDVMKEKEPSVEEKETKTWKDELPSTLAKTQMSRADKKTHYERRQANLNRQMAIATEKARERENMKKKTKRRLKKILALGILGAGAKMGMSKMAANKAM